MPALIAASARTRVRCAAITWLVAACVPLASAQGTSPAGQAITAARSAIARNPT